MEETRPLRPSPRALLLDDTIPSKEQSCYETIHQRVKDVFCPVEHPIPVPAGQRHDQLRPGAMALWRDGLRPADGAAFRLLLRALCGDERFRRGPQRPVGQEKGHACLRQPGGALHHSGAGFAERGLARSLAHVPAKRPERPDEHGAAACQRRGPAPVVPENQRATLSVQLPGDYPQPHSGHGGVFLRRDGRGDFPGPAHLWGGVPGAAAGSAAAPGREGRQGEPGALLDHGAVRAGVPGG